MTLRGFLFLFYSYFFDRTSYLYVRESKKNFISGDDLSSQTLKLEALLKNATKNVPFYMNLVAKSFNEMPVVNKSIIRSDLNQFLSSKIKLERLHSVTTSGSTGTPFKVFHDYRKRKRHSADNMFFMNLAGYEIGSSLYYLRVWNKLSRHSKLYSLLTNIKQIEIGSLSDDRIRELITLFNRNEKKSLLAFASTYESIYAYIKKHNIEHVGKNIQALVSMSEHLSEDTRRELSRIFNAPVVSRYSNMENGFIAQQLKTDDFYVINNTSYKVELFDLNNDIPIGLNQVGRIVITDLYNYAMPLIRYDTGDLGIFKEEYVNGIKRIVLASIEGRIVDMIYHTNGTLVSPHVITNTMWAYDNLKQWQFIQTDNVHYKFVLNGSLTPFQQQELEKTLRGYLGDSAIFSYEYVNEIPILASGKRKKIVNLMYKK